MNKIYIIGNLVDAPEVSETLSEVKVAKFNIAVNSGYGSNKVTDYFKVIAWKNIANICGTYLTKGSKVAVTGEIHNRNYEDKSGKKQTVTEITADGIEFLNPKQDFENI